MVSYFIKVLDVDVIRKLFQLSQIPMLILTVLEKASSDNLHFIQIYFLGTRAMMKFEYNI